MVFDKIQFGSLLVVLLAGPPNVSAQQVHIRDDRTVSIDMAAVPLREALEAIAARTPFEKLVLDEAVAGRRVTLKLDGLDVAQAVAAVLAAAEVNYVLAGGHDNAPVRLVAGEASFVAANVKRGLRELTSATRETDQPTERNEQAQTAPPADDGVAAAGAIVFENILTTPKVPIRPGTRVTLPFPGPDGAPLSVTMPAIRPTTLPFPTIPPPSAPATPPPTRPRGSSRDR